MSRKDSMRSKWHHAWMRAGSRLKRFYRSAPPYRLSRGDRLTALALSLAFFLLYLLTVSHHPNIAGDSPEMIGTCYSLGIMHPPGYPTYTMLGYLVTHIPVGSIAFRLNALSSLLHALTLGLLFAVLMKTTRHRAASAVTAAAIGVSPLFWFYSLVAEVFPLNDLFAVLLILVAIRAREEWLRYRYRASRRLLLAMLFLCGLALTHHHTILIVFPSLLIFAALPLLDLFRGLRRLAAGAGAFLLGLLPYAYIPIRASQKPYCNFTDPSSFSAFKDFVLRRYYGTSSLWVGPEAGHRLDLVFDCLKALDRQVYLAGLLVALLGMYAMARRRRGDFAPFFTALLLAGVAFPLLANVTLENAFHISTIERFYLLPTLLLAPFIAFGLAEIAARAKAAAGRLKVRDGVRTALVAALALLLLMPFYLPLKRTYEDVNLRDDLVGERYLQDMLRPLEDHCVLFLYGDVPVELVDFFYKACVPEQRDVTTIAWSFWGLPWYMDHLGKWYPELKLPDDSALADLPIRRSEHYKGWMAEYLMENNPQVSEFYTLSSNLMLSEAYRFIPSGLVSRIVPAGESVDGDALFGSLADFYAGLDPGIYDYARFGENRREQWLIQFISTNIGDSASCFRDLGQLERAAALLTLAYEVYPYQIYEFQAAEMCAELGAREEALALFDDFMSKNPLTDPKTWEALLKKEDILLEEGYR